MQYWYCSVSKGFVIADPTGAIVGIVDSEHEASAHADLAYHRDDRLDVAFVSSIGSSQ